MIATIFFGLILVLIFYNLWKSTQRPKDFPPGPPALPVLGNLTQYSLELFKGAMKFEGQYGDIQGIRLPGNWSVILNNPDDIRETMGKMEFSGRPDYNPVLDDKTVRVNYGVINSIGTKWFHNRRFSLRTLRDFGFAKRTSETIIMEEVTQLKEELREKVGQPLDTKNLFNVSVFNVIWSLLAGERYNHGDHRMKEFMELLDKAFNQINSGIQLVFTIFPWMLEVREKLPFLFPATNSMRMQRDLYPFFLEVIKQHRQNHQKGQPRDFIDAMIDEADANPNFEEMDMLLLLLDFFLAGSETTSTTLRWTLFLLANRPDVQEKLAAEISTLAENREINLNDRASLPYVDAVTQEIFRVATLAPFAVPHAAEEDIQYKGFSIPKGTIIFPNIYASHYSKNLWGDPDNFRPERFLTSDSKVGSRPKAWIPFGVGKRSCLGESLAKDEFFLFFTNIIQNFKVTFPAGEPPHGLEGFFGGTVRSPVDHNIVLSNRN